MIAHFCWHLDYSIEFAWFHCKAKPQQVYLHSLSFAALKLLASGSITLQ